MTIQICMSLNEAVVQHALAAASARGITLDEYFEERLRAPAAPGHQAPAVDWLQLAEQRATALPAGQQFLLADLFGAEWSQVPNHSVFGRMFWQRMRDRNLIGVVEKTPSNHTRYARL